ncbi:MAG: hypothetical protein WCK84_12935 [Bacteroidota bacterium]
MNIRTTFFVILLLILTFGCRKENNTMIQTVPPEDSVHITDWRTKYVGQYIFNVKYMNLVIGEDSAYWGISLYQHQGSIELYNKDRLLIKYSGTSPWVRCLKGSGWCQGNVSDPCISGCSGQKYFVQYWVSPLIFSNDSLLLFQNYSRLNGSGKFNHDTISFVTKLHDNWEVYEEYITGIRINQ